MGAHRSQEGGSKYPRQPKELYHREQLPGTGRRSGLGGFAQS